MGVGAPAGEPFEHSRLRLLHLQEQRIVRVAAEQQQDVAAGSDAAHADDLAGSVNVAELLQGVMLLAECPAVGAEELLDTRLGVFPLRSLDDEVFDRRDQRRVGHDAKPTIDIAGPLGEHPRAVPGIRLAHTPLRSLGIPLAHTVDPHLVADQVDQHPGVQLVFLVDPGDRRATHVLLQEGHLWGRKEVAIPVSAVTGYDGGIRLNITKKQVAELPPVD